MRVYIAGYLDHCIIRKVGDAAVVDHVEVTAVEPSGFEQLNDVAAVLLRTLLGHLSHGRLLETVRKIGLKPVASFGAYAQITACLAVDPKPQIDLVVESHQHVYVATAHFIQHLHPFAPE